MKPWEWPLLVLHPSWKYPAALHPDHHQPRNVAKQGHIMNILKLRQIEESMMVHASMMHDGCLSSRPTLPMVFKKWRTHQSTAPNVDAWGWGWGSQSQSMVTHCPLGGIGKKVRSFWLHTMNVWADRACWLIGACCCNICCISKNARKTSGAPGA